MSLRFQYLLLAALPGLAWAGPSSSRAAESAPNPAAVATTDFSLAIYKQLAGENVGKNLFFSPYSMEVALSMTAEGARGETALQMGKALRFPDSLRSKAVETPWDLGPWHSGMASLLDRFNAAKAVPKETRDKIARRGWKRPASTPSRTRSTRRR
jgi:hypothetical protein